MLIPGAKDEKGWLVFRKNRKVPEGVRSRDWEDASCSCTAGSMLRRACYDNGSAPRAAAAGQTVSLQGGHEVPGRVMEVLNLPPLLYCLCERSSSDLLSGLFQLDFQHPSS